MSDPADANLQLKKRARRRLVGAVAFAGLAAVVLPMIMDDEPKQRVQDVQIRIPGQEQTPFPAKVAKPAPAPDKAPAAETPAAAAAPAPIEPPLAVAPKPVEVAPAKPAEKKAEPEKAQRPAAEKPAAKTSEPQRAAAILGGKAPEAANGQYVILIGAFSNPANVKQLQNKIGELGIRVFTESLDSPEGKKTRVRAGPFTSAEAADKALDKMKRIGVNGVVAAKQ